MLTNKDYCDYETCVALKELGYREPTLAYYHGFLSSKPLLYLVIDEDCMPEDGVNIFDLLSNSNKYKDSKNIDAPTLWEAQKWLREEKKIDVLIQLESKDIHLSSKYYSVYMSYMSRFRREFSYIPKDFDSYEDALFEGIKKAVKILKKK